MKKILFTIVFLSLLKLNAQVPDSIKRSVDSVLLILQQKSLYTKKVNWKKVRKKAYEMIKDVSTLENTYDALVYAFSAVNDHHGFIRMGNRAFQLENPNKKRDTNLLKELYSLPPRIVISKVGAYGYVRVPRMMPPSDSAMNVLANQLNDSICKLNATGVKGWIVDLRTNTGGNFRPMIGGLASIFCDGSLGTFVGNTGVVTDSWRIEQGQFFMNERQGVKTNNKCSVDCNLPIAVLIGPGTGSSGEVTAISFSGRSNTRFFGERTGGFANSTQGFYAANKKIYMLLVTAGVKDRNGKFFDRFLYPDQSFNAKIKLDVIEDDLVKKSIEWLKTAH